MIMIMMMSSVTVFQILPYQLGCVQCAGVVLSAGFLCREGGGLTRNRIQPLPCV